MLGSGYLFLFSYISIDLTADMTEAEVTIQSASSSSVEGFVVFIYFSFNTRLLTTTTRWIFFLHIDNVICFLGPLKIGMSPGLLTCIRCFITKEAATHLSETGTFQKLPAS